MCIFCEIIKGNIPTHKIYEDNDFIAILDMSQTTKGHCLVIPKQHFDNILHMPDELLAKYLVVVKKVAKMLEKNLSPNGYNILSNINEVSGQTVMHAHIHIIPRYSENDSFKLINGENHYDLDGLENLIKK